jgi:hypothetical protein
MLHLNKFIDRVEGHDARGNRDFVMSMTDARALHADITRLLADLHVLHEQINKIGQEPVVEVKIGGGTF